MDITKVEEHDSKEIDDFSESDPYSDQIKKSLESNLIQINNLINILKGYDFIGLKELNSLYKVRFNLGSRLEEIKEILRNVCV